jgi:glycerol kinase
VAEDVILAIDAGTTGVTALLVDHAGAVRAQGYRELTQHYPRPGWVEQDATEIWEATLSSAGDALASAPDCLPIAVGISNQRETLLFWDRKDGRPLHPAIVWQCRRSESICQELRDADVEDEIRRKTGLRLDPYFSGTKVLWLCREDESLPARIAKGDVCFGTIDSWLAWQLSDGAVHVTDVTNASRTLCYDIDRLAWDDGLLATFGLNPTVMPEVQPSGSAHGATVASDAIPGGLPIAALAGDQQAAVYGQACFEPGMTKATYGTGCFILTSTGERRVDSRRGLLTTLAASVGSGPPRYALEGSIFVAGAAVQWCRDNLGIVGDAGEAEVLAGSVPDAGGVVFVPAFAGLGSPHWGPDVRGAVYGLTGAARVEQVVRAAVDSMAFQAQDVLNVMREETGMAMRELRVDGGASANDRLMQLQADLTASAVSRPLSVESTGMGGAFLAGLTVGFWRDEDEIAALRREAVRIEPSQRAETSRAEYERWRTAVEGLLETQLPPV